jgi:hypothetical protein
MSSNMRRRKGVMVIPPVCVCQPSTGGIVPQQEAEREERICEEGK